MGASHRFGREVLLRVWPSVMGAEPTRRELQLVGAIAAGEGGYGKATYILRSIPDGAIIAKYNDTNNWGAVQAGKPPCNEASSVLITDSSPRKRSAANPKGYYNICLRTHETPELGCASYLRTLLASKPPVRSAVRSGSAAATAAAMYWAGYYEGFHDEPRLNILDYQKLIMRNASAIAKSLSEPLDVIGTVPDGGELSTDTPWWDNPSESGRNSKSKISTNGGVGILAAFALIGGYVIVRSRR